MLISFLLFLLVLGYLYNNPRQWIGRGGDGEVYSIQTEYTSRMLGILNTPPARFVEQETFNTVMKDFYVEQQLRYAKVLSLDYSIERFAPNRYAVHCFGEGLRADGKTEEITDRKEFQMTLGKPLIQTVRIWEAEEGR